MRYLSVMMERGGVGQGRSRGCAEMRLSLGPHGFHARFLSVLGI